MTEPASDKSKGETVNDAMPSGGGGTSVSTPDPELPPPRRPAAALAGHHCERAPDPQDDGHVTNQGKPRLWIGHLLPANMRQPGDRVWALANGFAASMKSAVRQRGEGLFG